MVSLLKMAGLLAYSMLKNSTVVPLVAHHRWLALLCLLTRFQAKQISFIRAKHPATAIKYLEFVVPLAEGQHCSVFVISGMM